MRIDRRTLVGAAIAAASVGGLWWSQGPRASITILGDSTAIGDRIPLVAQPLNYVPHLDGTRWWNQLGRRVANHGVGGQPLRAGLQALRAGLDVAGQVVVFDRMNAEEQPDGYLATLGGIVSLPTPRSLLILPQIANAPAGAEASRMARLNDRIAVRWPQHCLAPGERTALLTALADPATREDGVHRNPAGQAIKARIIRGWMDRHGW